MPCAKPPTKKAREGLPTPSAMRSVMLRVQVRSLLRCRHVAGRAKDRTCTRNITERMADGVGNPSLAFVVGGFAHGIGERCQTAAYPLQIAGRFVGRFGVSHVFSSVAQSKCHRIYSAISATERNTFPAFCTSSIRRRMSFASKGRLSV